MTNTIRRLHLGADAEHASGRRTRLLVRTRANYAPRSFRLLALPLGLVDATYGVAMLRAIAMRAETIDSSAQ